MRGKKSSGKPWWFVALRLAILSPLRYLILLVIAAALVYWQWANIVYWVHSAVRATLSFSAGVCSFWLLPLALWSLQCGAGGYSGLSEDGTIG